MSTARNALMTHFWGKHIKPDAGWLADEAIRALTDAGYTIMRTVTTDEEAANRW